MLREGGRQINILAVAGEAALGGQAPTAGGGRSGKRITKGD